MKKSNVTLVVFVLLGLLAGSIAAHLLSGVPSISFLTKSTDIVWHPQADLQAIRYDVELDLRINLLSILGAAAAVWIYRRL